MLLVSAGRQDLDAQILAWMHEPDALTAQRDDLRFDALARRLFAFQFEHCRPYARFCEARGVTPDRIDHWTCVPAVPTGAFKEMALRCFSEESTLKTFRTSGTSTPRRGALHLDTLALYEASLLATLRGLLFPGVARASIRVLAPSPREAPDSSLSHMFGCAIHALGTPASGFDWHEGMLHLDSLRRAVAQANDKDEPLALCGTAFAFVHLLDDPGARELELPPGSCIMETGGFKGHSREMSRAELYARLEERFAVPDSRIVNQYGMTELGSQFYDSVLAFPGEPRRKLGPPWARVRLVDPESGEEARPGDVGMITVHDLANTGSVAAVLTADLGRALEDGFQVLGRDPGAEARGCSIAADLMLARAR